MTAATLTVTTPEGIELEFTTATAAERIVAFAFDALVLAVALFVLALLAGLASFVLGPAPLFLLFFVARLGYFAIAEIRGNGRTFGKRRLGLRVIRADGGPLSTEVVLARNLTREVELFLPLQVLLLPETWHDGQQGALAVVALVWVLLLLFFPLTNRHRLRIGDLLAGTRVVAAPRPVLARDLAADAQQARATDAEPTFLPRHLEVYGIHELQVLEDVLRKARTPGAKETLDAVSKSIKRRIGWSDPSPPPGDYRFLRAFYAAQRRHLEDRLQLGHRKEDKRTTTRGRREPGR